MLLMKSLAQEFAWKKIRVNSICPGAIQTPINKQAWGEYIAEHDHWALVGIPSESVEYDGVSIITGRITLIPLAEAEEPYGVGRKAENQFYARFKGPVSVKDLDGMSGGPVFALKKVGDTWKYTVIGIQSAWYEKAKIIAACPFSSFGLELEKIVAVAKAKRGDRARI